MDLEKMKVKSGDGYITKTFAHLKTLEWNINQRSNELKNEDYVEREIRGRNPDIFVLLEFKGKKNYKFITESLSDYHIVKYFGILDESTNKWEGNGILIGLKKDVFEAPSLKT